MASQELTRRRTIDWDDPLALAAEAPGMSGLDFMRAIASGALPPPPISRLVQLEIAEVEEGRTVFRITPDESMYNPIGAVHGGMHATVLDGAMGCAVHTTLPAGVGYTTLELKVNYVRPFTVEGGPALAEGIVLHRGSRQATAEGKLRRESDGKLLAHATTTCIVLGG
jgi:uncharacterized protein (TIGR00369 family)